ncbi:hypothetical protein SRABI128_05795 [Microbacterium sp. Bi128]|nr:hypothetical protein SRABI128_05795 [Microbacterium sp. Bi128]
MTGRRCLVRRGHAEGPPDSALGIREPVGVRDSPHGRLGDVDEIELHVGVGQGLEEGAEDLRGRPHAQSSNGHPAHPVVVLQTFKSNASLFGIQHSKGVTCMGSRHDQCNIGTPRAGAGRILDNCLDMRPGPREDMQDARHALRLVRNSHDSDFRRRVDPGYSGHLGLFPGGLEQWMTVKAGQDQRPGLRHEGGPHMDRNTEPAGVFNTPQVQYLAAGGGELKHFLAREDLDLPRRRDNPGVRGVDAVDVRVYLANIGFERSGQGDRCEIRAAAAERGHPVPFLRPALESCDDGDLATGQTTADAVRPDIGDVCLAVDVVGNEAGRTARKCAGQLAEIRQGNRQKGRGHKLADAQQGVKVHRQGPGGNFRGKIAEFIGGVPHGGHHRHDPIAVGPCFGDPLGCPEDTRGIRQGRTAKLLNNDTTRGNRPVGFR